MNACLQNDITHGYSASDNSYRVVEDKSEQLDHSKSFLFFCFLIFFLAPAEGGYETKYVTKEYRLYVYLRLVRFYCRRHFFSRRTIARSSVKASPVFFFCRQLSFFFGLEHRTLVVRVPIMDRKK